MCVASVQDGTIKLHPRVVTKPVSPVPSEGSVIAYYLSEFRVPAGQEVAVDNTMASLDKIVDKLVRSVGSKPGSDLVFDDVVSSGTV